MMIAGAGKHELTAACSMGLTGLLPFEASSLSLPDGQRSLLMVSQTGDLMMRGCATCTMLCNLAVIISAGILSAATCPTLHQNAEDMKVLTMPPCGCVEGIQDCPSSGSRLNRLDPEACLQQVGGTVLPKLGILVSFDNLTHP